MTFSCESNDEQTVAFIRGLNDACRSAVFDVTMPFYAEQAGEMKQCGSGVLLQIGKQHFIISAAHTFDLQRILNLPIFVTNGVIGERLIPFEEVKLRSSATAEPYHRTDDPFDICVCELPADMGKQICRGKRFLRLNDIDPWDRQDPRSSYMVFGYPSAINQTDEANRKVVSNAAEYRTFVYSGERGELENHDSKVRIALDYNPETTTDDAFAQITAPHPSGMSGCGIWRLAEAGSLMPLWTVGDIKLVAIEHSINSKKVLLGTRIRYALRLIFNNHQGLRSVMMHHYGQLACTL